MPFSSPVFEVIKDENRIVKRTYTYEGAARILDVEKILEATVYPNEKGSFSIKITDNQIDKNNGVFTVSYEDGECTIQKESSTEFDIALDILGASRIILGREGLTLDEISYISNVEI